MQETMYNEKGGQMRKIPIIYSSKYNISFMGFEVFISFDVKKFKKIYKTIKKELSLNPTQFYEPCKIRNDELLLVHSKDYLKSLRKSSVIAQIVETPILKYIPNVILYKGIIQPMEYAVKGTLMGMEIALRYGWAINLSGGYHHAKSNYGSGFCIYADIPIAIKAIHKKYPNLRLLIIDLDSHQGNGCSYSLSEETQIAILDIYNPTIFPKDRVAENLVSFKVPICSRTRDRLYLKTLKHWLPKALDEHLPDVVIYNSGTDIYIKDPIGGLEVSENGILMRDEIVFATAKKRKIPLLMLLSGGYHKDSSNIVAKSILNLIHKGLASY